MKNLVNLVIVESPTKAKTLARFLGKDYRIEASKGHVKDLPKSTLGVDVEHNFEPQYEVASNKKKVVSELKMAAKDAGRIYLATDPDREGEAIAQHVYEVVSAKSKEQRSKPISKIKTHRVVFHEITADAVKEAFAHPRDVDADLVDAQKARRVLDRLVGYKLSPLLWKKIRYGLSAGRVQSVVVRLIVEREREREKFGPQEYWRIHALLHSSSDLQSEFKAELKSRGGKDIFVKETHKLFAGPYQTERTTIGNKAQAEKIVKALAGEEFVVGAVEKVKVCRAPGPPFITATLQRAAAGALGFSGKRTMRAAQSLYERGLITYHRTDSVALSRTAVANIRQTIVAQYGDRYCAEKPRIYKTRSRVAQEAHEAIRPTKLTVQGSRPKIQGSLGSDEERLYDLIWRRTAACQMADAVFDATKVAIGAGDSDFEAKGSVLRFDGFLKAQTGRRDDTLLPRLRLGDKLNLIKLEPSPHLTAPPPRYTEAGLIKELEKFEIGRPSTYAPTISTVLDRGYVVREDNCFRPDDVGVVVNDLLAKHFPEIVDLKFTAEMEDDLDKIADGKRKWVPVIGEFYKPFERKLRIKNEELRKGDFTTLEETKEKCPECKEPLVVKLGKYGKFLSCSGFPRCKYSRPYEDKDNDGEADEFDESQLEGRCPECRGELTLKEGRFGKFIACGNYPKCKFTKPYLDKIGMKCPECKQGEVVVKRSRRGKTFYGCSCYPACKWASWKDPRSV